MLGSSCTAGLMVGFLQHPTEYYLQKKIAILLVSFTTPQGMLGATQWKHAVMMTIRQNTMGCQWSTTYHGMLTETT